jgi:hypothetical protein
MYSRILGVYIAIYKIKLCFACQGKWTRHVYMHNIWKTWATRKGSQGVPSKKITRKLPRRGRTSGKW